MMFFEINLINRKSHIRFEGYSVEDILYHFPSGFEYSHDIRLDAVAWDTVEATITPNYSNDVIGKGWESFNEDLAMMYLEEHEDAVFVAERHEYWRVESQSYREVDSFFGA